MRAIGAEKNRFKQTKRRGMSRTGKTEIMSLHSPKHRPSKVPSTSEKCNIFQQKTGVMVLSARLAKILNLWTSLTTCLCIDREQEAKSVDIRQRTTKKTAEVQGNYPDFKQKMKKQQNFVFSKVREVRPLLSKCRLTARRLKKLTTRC